MVARIHIYNGQGDSFGEFVMQTHPIIGEIVEPTIGSFYKVMDVCHSFDVEGYPITRLLVYPTERSW